MVHLQSLGEIIQVVYIHTHLNGKSVTPAQRHIILVILYTIQVPRKHERQVVKPNYKSKDHPVTAPPRPSDQNKKGVVPPTWVTWNKNASMERILTIRSQLVTVECRPTILTKYEDSEDAPHKRKIFEMRLEQDWTTWRSVLIRPL
ncbi:hypothetical protein Pint_12894 [Pistacia integerrima]|uniref:Uncharacterized protein n=1 Tax=Pistacia integerrima TaxID=434235 RepID=A0ACC0Y7B4_9ROSI|nr:hypothetical protein Pint_12894 [Pistacia integerrima]